jgi:hypothetical protein
VPIITPPPERGERRSLHKKGQPPPESAPDQDDDATRPSGSAGVYRSRGRPISAMMALTTASRSLPVESTRTASAPGPAAPRPDSIPLVAALEFAKHLLERDLLALLALLLLAAPGPDPVVGREEELEGRVREHHRAEVATLGDAAARAELALDPQQALAHRRMRRHLRGPVGDLRRADRAVMSRPPSSTRWAAPGASAATKRIPGTRSSPAAAPSSERPIQPRRTRPPRARGRSARALDRSPPCRAPAARSRSANCRATVLLPAPAGPSITMSSPAAIRRA